LGTRVASILAEIGIDSSKFTSGSKGVMSGIKDMLGGLGKIGPIAGIATAAFGILVDQLNKAEQAAVESAKVDAKLEAVLKSTGNAAGLSAGQLDQFATAISKTSGIDDEIVKNGEAVLATFTKISGGEFQSAMQAAVDMSAVLGGDLQGSIVQVGKAMNDFSGYTALKRAGVSFTGEQMAQIAQFKEMNDLVGYQQMLLAELSTEFGGAASAINAAGDGSENLKIAIGNLQEAIGEGLIPVKRRWNELMTEAADGLTNTVSAANEEKTALQELNMVYVNGVGYVQDGVRVTAEYANELLTAQNHAKIVGEALNEMYGAGQNAASGMGAATGATEAFSEAVIPVSAYMNELTTAMLFNQAAAGLDAAASLQLAETMGLVDAESALVLNTLQSIRDAYDSGKISLEEYNEAVKQLNQQMQMIQSKTVTLTVRTSLIDQYGLWGQGPNNAYIGLAEGNRAIGGPVLSHTPYIVGEEGPELFVPNASGNIIPNNKLSGGGSMGGGVYYYTLARAVAEAFVTMGIGR
jgi:hypothetical protein